MAQAKRRNNARRQRLSIAIPSSLVSARQHLRDKTEIIGRIGRSASIFRVQEIIIYPDNPDETRLIRLILDYMNTPQYLRKYLFKKTEELRYAGILPPLRTPHHPIETLLGKVKVGDIREGVVVKQRGGAGYVDIGLRIPLLLEGKTPSKNSLITVRITEIQPHLKGKIHSNTDTAFYWGYKARGIKSDLKTLLQGDHYYLRIGTSRLGTPFKEICGELQRSMSESDQVLVVFGSYVKSIIEIMGINKKSIPTYFDFYINTIPGQGSATVRTEEALHATLAVLNLIR
jgi:predicted SPOUT superfamily RNA methylase MTH1